MDTTRSSRLSGGRGMLSPPEPFVVRCAVVAVPLLHAFQLAGVSSHAARLAARLCFLAANTLVVAWSLTRSEY